jgi:hypothetical protein
LEKYLELWDGNLLSFQYDGKPRPDHLPTREEVVAYMNGHTLPPMPRPTIPPPPPAKTVPSVKIRRTVITVRAPKPTKVEPAPAPTLEEKPKELPSAKKAVTVDTQKVVQTFLRHKGGNKQYDKKVVDAVVYMHDKLSMDLSVIAAQFERRWSWANDMYSLRFLTPQVWLHSGIHLRWRERLSKSEIRLLSKMTPEAQNRTYPELLATHTEPEHFDRINWSKMVVHTRDLRQEIDTLTKALAVLTFDTVRDVTSSESVVELKKDIESALTELALLVEDINKKL